jgi:heme oxygenase
MNQFVSRAKGNMSVLREITSEIHKRAESTPFVQYMYSGDMTPRDYSIYLKQIVEVYSNLEYYSKVSGITNNFVDLDRAEYIREDIKELDIFTEIPTLPSVSKYIDRIMRLYHSEDKSLLMAHVYVRHMGDLFGGKIISKKVPGSGKYYQFKDRPTLIKQISEKITLDLAEEAIKSFELSIDVFNEVYEIITNETDK